MNVLNEAREEITALQHIAYHGTAGGVYFADLDADDISKIHSLFIGLVEQYEKLDRAFKTEVRVCQERTKMLNRTKEQLEAMREVAGDYVYREYVERLEEQLEAVQKERDYYSQFSDRGDWLIYRHEWLAVIDMLREAEDTLRVNARGPELIGLRHRIAKVLEPYPEREPATKADRDRMVGSFPTSRPCDHDWKAPMGTAHYSCAKCGIPASEIFLASGAQTSAVELGGGVDRPSESLPPDSSPASSSPASNQQGWAAREFKAVENDLANLPQHIASVARNALVSKEYETYGWALQVIADAADAATSARES